MERKGLIELGWFGEIPKEKSMREEGWTLSDLAGELHALGIDINEVDNFHCEYSTAQEAAQAIERDLYKGER